MPSDSNCADTLSAKLMSEDIPQDPKALEQSTLRGFLVSSDVRREPLKDRATGGDNGGKNRGKLVADSRRARQPSPQDGNRALPAALTRPHPRIRPSGC